MGNKGIREDLGNLLNVIKCRISFPFHQISSKSHRVLIPEIGETEGQVKNGLVPIFNVFNLVPEYL